MAGAGDVGLKIDATITKIAGAEAAHRVEGAGKLGFVVTDLHADTTTAGSGFEHDRVTDACSLPGGFLEAVEQPGAGCQRYASLFRQGARFVL